jgi:hypothetical protein
MADALNWEVIYKRDAPDEALPLWEEPDGFFHAMDANHPGLNLPRIWEARWGMHHGVAYAMYRAEDGVGSKWWCGYIHIPHGHPFAHKTWDELYDMDTGDGNITWSKAVNPSPARYYDGDWSIGIDGDQGRKHLAYTLSGTELVTTLAQVRDRVHRICEKVNVYQPTGRKESTQ